MEEPEHIEKLGPAWGLYAFLVDRQTPTPTPVGFVNYGHTITLDWIRDRIAGGNAIPKRTIRDWMDRLREKGYIATQRKSQGLRIQILNQRKFPSQLQIPFDKPVPVQIEEVRKTGTSDRRDSVNQIDIKVSITRDVSIYVTDNNLYKEHPIASRSELKPQEARVEPFEIFFSAYPRKIQRQTALASWRMLQLDGHLGEILASIDAWKNSGAWDEERFVPYPKTFLQNALWKEQSPPRKENKKHGPITPQQHDEIFERNVEAFLERNHR